MNLERYSFKDFAGWSSKDDFDECLNTLEIFSCSFMLKEEMHGITFYASSISKLQENISNYLKEIYNG